MTRAMTLADNAAAQKSLLPGIYTSLVHELDRFTASAQNPSFITRIFTTLGFYKADLKHQRNLVATALLTSLEPLEYLKGETAISIKKIGSDKIHDYYVSIHQLLEKYEDKNNALTATFKEQKKMYIGPGSLDKIIQTFKKKIDDPIHVLSQYIDSQSIGKSIRASGQNLLDTAREKYKARRYSSNASTSASALKA